jgi:hypothetical protein
MNTDDRNKMVIALLLATVVVIGILAGYNPLEPLLSAEEDRTPGRWSNAPLANDNLGDEVEGNPRLLPESESKDIELE